jgi:hypothetical protein
LVIYLSHLAWLFPGPSIFLHIFYFHPLDFMCLGWLPSLDIVNRAAITKSMQGSLLYLHSLHICPGVVCPLFCLCDVLHFLLMYVEPLSFACNETDHGAWPFFSNCGIWSFMILFLNLAHKYFTENFYICFHQWDWFLLLLFIPCPILEWV